MPQGSRDVLRDIDRRMLDEWKLSQRAECDMRLVRDDARLIATKFTALTGAKWLEQDAASTVAVDAFNRLDMDRTKNRARVVVDPDLISDAAKQMLRSKDPEEAKAIAAGISMGYALSLAKGVMDMAERQGVKSPYEDVRGRIRHLFDDPSAPPAEQKLNERLGEVIWQVYKSALVVLFAKEVALDSQLRGPFRDKSIAAFLPADRTQAEDMASGLAVELQLDAAEHNRIVSINVGSFADPMARIWQKVLAKGMEGARTELKSAAYSIAKTVDKTITALGLGTKAGMKDERDRPYATVVKDLIIDAVGAIVAASILEGYPNTQRLVGNPNLLIDSSTALLRKYTQF